MEIISITEISKQKSRILLDTEESFVLYRSEIRILRLKEGMEMSVDVYDSITRSILPRRCKLRAMNLLKERCYTSYSLTKKLLDGGYPRDIVDRTLEYVKSYGYVDDLDYAMSYIRDKESVSSRQEIKQKLLGKGISGQLVDEAYRRLGEEREEYGEEGNSEIEYELIRKTLKKRGFSPDMDYENKQKVLAYFYRRGFDIDKVRKCMSEENV